jgi:hypothetical protein
MSHIETIDLGTNLFNGSISPALFDAQSIYILNLYHNFLTGTIPVEISKLTRVQFISLYRNMLVGSIPDVVYDMTSLNTLALEHNLLTGTISPHFGALTGLRILKLGENLFKGTLPEEIYQLSDLRDLDLRTGYLTGTISSSIGKLVHLRKLQLYDNRFSGTIPNNIFQIPKLYTVGLDGNMLTGTIPDNISEDRHYFNSIAVYDNHLTGSIPVSFSAIRSLRGLFVFENYLTGSLPPTLGKPFFMVALIMKKLICCFSLMTGGLGNASFLDYLIADTNYLSGSIPPLLFNYSTALRYLYLYQNHFSGELPPNTGGMTRLIEVLLYSNALSGKFFDYFSSNQYHFLQVINIADNLFSGSLPSSKLFFDSPLIALSMSKNCFIGTIPSSICNLNEKRLQVLNLDGIGSALQCKANRVIQLPRFVQGSFSSLGLEGTLPSCLFNMKALETLHLSGTLHQHQCIDSLTSHLLGNNLVGSIPDILDDSVALNDLTLSNNGLTGTIPVSLQLHSFVNLDLSANRLHGTLVDNFQVAFYQHSLALAVNRLSGNLPHSILRLNAQAETNITSLNVLSTNIFSCDLHSDLKESIPSLDLYAESYSCGSSEFEIASYIALAIACVMILGVAFACYLHRSAMLKLYEQAKLWWHVAISLLITRTSSSSSIDKQRHLQSLSGLAETKAYLVHVQIIVSWVVFVGILLVLWFIPSYAIISSVSDSVIVSQQYGYVLSMAFLHGLAPVIFIGLTIVLLLIAFMFITAVSKRIMISIFSYSAPPIPTHYSRYLIQKYSLLFLVHLINLTVTMVVNIAYVNAILTDSQLTRTSLLTIQILVGLFKLLWNILYIPWCSIRLSSYMSHPRSMQNRLIMSITNYIFAPVVASASVNQSCFYYVFKKFPQQVSSVDITLCGGYSCCVPADACSLCCTSPAASIFTAVTTPSFQYSYACGTAIIVTYIPVLLYSYAIFGFIIPLLRYLAATRSDYAKNWWLCTWLLGDEVSGKVNGRNNIVMIILHLTVLMTFGLASPILGLVIVVAILNDCWMSTLLVGRYITVLTLASSSSSTAAAVSLADYDQTIMKDAWRAQYACYWIVIVTVSIFWGILFFDMIADRYGWPDGLSVTANYLILVPPALIISRKYLHRIPCLRPVVSRIDSYLRYGFRFDSLASHQRIVSQTRDMVGVEMNPILIEPEHKY